MSVITSVFWLWDDIHKPTIFAKGGKDSERPLHNMLRDKKVKGGCITVIAIDKDSWDEHVPNSSGWVVVDFWGPRCKPCLELMPAMERLAEKYAEKMTFYSLDTSKAMRLAMAQGVMSLPVIAFFRDGEKKDELSGEFGAQDVENKILELLG